MGIQAQWHDCVFEQSPTAIRTITSFDTSMALDFERNEDTEGEPATQTVRRGLQKINISYEAYAALGVWPKIEFEGWTWNLAQGTHAPFYINGESFLGREFILKNVTMSSEVVNGRGFIEYAEIKLEFEEYAEEPSGLKIDKGFETSFRPGIQEYTSGERDMYIRDRATTEDKIRLEQGGGWL